MPSFSCVVENSIPADLRLDRYIAGYLKLLSRSQIKARQLTALLDGRSVKISRALRGGERLELTWTEAESPFLVPENLPLDVIYEDSRVIVVNKAQGMVVHPGAGNSRGTLANALLYRRLAKDGAFAADALTPDAVAPDASAAGTALRPGIVHRLDKDTSGVIIAAWDDEALAFLGDQFRARKARKSYAAIVQGCPMDKLGRIDKRITRSRKDRKTFTVSDNEGRPSLTYFRLVRSYGNYSLLLLRPKTGRTHQIRVHLKYLGNPILGDPIYGRADPRFPSASLMLHAKSLSLVLPGHEIPRMFRTRLPERFGEVIRVLKNH
ncbi:MAG: RluA family pseudouridine synthase [Treponema sp.]|jgi:23S rRNA pseudouridine1911/1915/1917 synthase|nr:RluA family pseudouridine synthase [Treponema sp.]